jgi:hypothetical protein
MRMSGRRQPLVLDINLVVYERDIGHVLLIDGER